MKNYNFRKQLPCLHKGKNLRLSKPRSLEEGHYGAGSRSLPAQLVLVLRELGGGPPRDGTQTFEEGASDTWDWYF